jgi:UDP-glucose 4-epimerase
MSGGFSRNVPQGVRLIIGDLKDADFVSRLMKEERFDVVYHLAAYAAEGLSHFIRNYNYQNNLIATTNLISQSVRSKTVKKFIFTSSIAIWIWSYTYDRRYGTTSRRSLWDFETSV